MIDRPKRIMNFLQKYNMALLPLHQLKMPYIRSTEAELLLIETQSVVQPLYAEVKQIWSSGYHGGNSLWTELLWLEIVDPLQTTKEGNIIMSHSVWLMCDLFHQTDLTWSNKFGKYDGI